MYFQAVLMTRIQKDEREMCFHSPMTNKNCHQVIMILKILFKKPH